MLFFFNVCIITFLAYDTVVPSVHASTAAAFSIFFLPILSAVLFLGALAAVGGSVFYLTLMLNYSESIISGVLWMNIIIMCVSSVACLLTLQFFMAIIFFFFAVLQYWYFYSIRDRIPFASAVLTTACTVIKDHLFGLLATALGFLLIQFLWISLWSVAMYGMISTFQAQNASGSSSSSNDPSSTTSLNGLQAFCYFLMLISLYWGIQTTKNVVSVTVAGTTGILTTPTN